MGGGWKMNKTLIPVYKFQVPVTMTSSPWKLLFTFVNTESFENYDSHILYTRDMTHTYVCVCMCIVCYLSLREIQHSTWVNLASAPVVLKNHVDMHMLSKGSLGCEVLGECAQADELNIPVIAGKCWSWRTMNCEPTSQPSWNKCSTLKTKWV